MGRSEVVPCTHSLFSSRHARPRARFAAGPPALAQEDDDADAEEEELLELLELPLPLLLDAGTMRQESGGTSARQSQQTSSSVCLSSVPRRWCRRTHCRVPPQAGQGR